MKTKLLLAFMLVSIGLFGQQNPIQIDANGLTQTLTAGGVVTRGQIVKINSAGQVVPVLTTDTSGAIGIAATSQTSQGNSITVSIAGTPLVQIDSGGCTAGNIVSISTITAGAGHCAATASGQQVGVALSISSPGSNFWNVQLSLGGSGSSPTSGVPGPVFNVKDPKYGAVGDAKHSNSVAVTGGNATITSTDNPWVSTDVGKVIFCVFGGTPTNGFALGTKIQTFNSAGSVTLSNTAVGGTATYGCVWATQDETASFQAAFNAAANAQFYPGFGSPNLGQPSVIYIPPGGYFFNGNWYDCNNASGNSLCPAVVGAGWQSSILYPSSTFTSGARACFMDAVNATSLIWRDFGIFGDAWTFSCTGGTPFMRLNSVGIFDIRNIRVDFVGINSSGQHVLDILGTQEGLIENVWMQSQGTGTTGACFALESSANITINGLLTSNCFINEIFINSGVRNASGGQVTVTGGFSDECAANPTAGCVQLQGSIVNFVGGAIFGEPTSTATGALQLDATSTAYLSSMNVGPFNTATNSNGIGCASGATVVATGTTIRGGGTTGLLISGPASGSCQFVDDGGNSFSRWNSTTGTTITPALFAGAFSSTVAYKASITHTPNTCYAVTGNLLATAQNLCTLLLDQNYQVVNITAQSGGTTPAASSCTGAPVITLSDGTRTATLTMTTGKTAWSSSVDASSVGAIMASGATLTVSIGANTCATPPSNVSVNYVLQSAINP